MLSENVIKKKSDTMVGLIKVIASFMVVAIHTAMFGWSNGDPQSSVWVAKNYYDSFARAAVPLFFMTSGVNFLSKKELTIRYMLKKTERIILIFCFFYLFYKAADIGFKRTLNDPNLLVNALLDGYKPKYHLWFLIDLLLIYFLVPFLHYICKSEKKEFFRYYVILFFIFSILLPTIKLIPGIPPAIVSYINPILRLQGVGYIGYFVTGWYLSNNDIFSEKKQLNNSIILPGSIYFSAALAIFYLTKWSSEKTGIPNSVWYEYLSLFTFIEAIALFVLLKKTAEFIRINNFHKIETALNFISKTTFFIYLIHPFIIDRGRILFGFYPTNYDSWYGIPLCVSVYWLTCFILAIPFQKIPILNRIFGLR